MSRKRLNARERINGLVDERNRLRCKVFDLEWNLADLRSRKVCVGCSGSLTSVPITATPSSNSSLFCEPKLSRLKSTCKKVRRDSVPADVLTKNHSRVPRSLNVVRTSPLCYDFAARNDMESNAHKWAQWSKMVSHPTLPQDNLGTFFSDKQKPGNPRPATCIPIPYSPESTMMDLDLTENSTETLSPSSYSDEPAIFPQQSNFHFFPVVDAPKWTNPCSVESVSKVDKFSLHPFYLQDLKFALPIISSRTPKDPLIKFLWSGGEFVDGQDLVITYTLGTDGNGVWLYESDGLDVDLVPTFLPHELFVTNSYSHYYAISFNRTANLFPYQLFGEDTRYRGLPLNQRRFEDVLSGDPILLDQLYSDEVLRTLKFRCYTLLVFPAQPTDSTDLFAQLSPGTDRCEVTLCRSAKGNEFQVVVYCITDLDALMLNLFRLPTLTPNKALLVPTRTSPFRTASWMAAVSFPSS